VTGANDIVNPLARAEILSPIYGMPILNADQAQHVYVVKRRDGRGYADIPNALFYGDNCNMVYGDAQAVLVKMIEGVRGRGLGLGAALDRLPRRSRLIPVGTKPINLGGPDARSLIT
jgi:proton-translocating NAD(P)+ transhydrogenase subunit beta